MKIHRATSIGELVKVLLIILFCSSLDSHAMPLGEISQSGGSFGMRTIAWGLQFSLWAAPAESEEAVTVGMDWDVVTPMDVGHTFIQSSDTSENFGLLASMLTSGTAEQEGMYVFFPGDGGTGWPGVLNKFVPTQSVDFYGYEITEIGLTVNSLTIDSPGSNPNHDGIWTDTTFDVTFTIYGVPEPTTVVLLGLGGLAMIRGRRGKIKKL